jgi:predicted homoserine dehydrogenase-like protein
MYLYSALQERERDGNPIRVCLVGAGKFGSMFLNQIITTPGLEVTSIADLNPHDAKLTCKTVGWTDDQIDTVTFTDDAVKAIQSDDSDVIVEATGHPSSGVKHAREAFKMGKHIIMVNVEADVLAGPLLAKEATSAGVVYSMAYGDQPALTCELVEWARSCGFHVTAAGKGTKYLPKYHMSTPDTVWDYYGITHDEAIQAGMNSKMFNSFLDGTKSALEMAAISNACNLAPPNNGLSFPPCGMNDLAHILRPVSEGGQLEFNGQVEVVSSIERDGRAVSNDLRWGVYVVLEAQNDYASKCFKEYGMNTDNTGRYSAMFKPFHLIGLELNISIISAAIRGVPTGSTKDFCGDVVATAKRHLKVGEVLDGEGGATVWGKLIPAATSLSKRHLPIGLAQGITIKKPIKVGEILCWDDVVFDPTDLVIAYRKSMESLFSQNR